ncbi:MAG TPA: translation initiation factor IF-2 [Bacteroidetes bacterium]|nr:translation initiation factor IF-2 [Ignavibacteria bacterium]HCA42700.1 translation initiation factor IF-2 [Bacteroidota bacterium]HCN36492.1 translation initiation factor IF-2 [Bacteroidota bacterium]
MAEPKAKKTKLMKLLSEIQTSRENVINFLEQDLKMENITVNTSLESDVVEKVRIHFRKDLEDHQQHTKKLEKFTNTYDVKFVEIEEKKKKEEEERARKEEEERIRKNLEEQKRIEEEQRQKQLKEAYEKAEQQRKLEEEKQKAERLKKKSAETPKSQKPETAKDTTQDKSNVKPPQTDKKPEFQKNKFTKPENRNKDFKKPFDKNKNKPKVEKITIKDVKNAKKKQAEADGRTFKPKKPEQGGTDFKNKSPKIISAPTSTDSKKFGDKKDKDKKKFQADYEKKKVQPKSQKVHRLKDVTQKEIDAAIRETFAKIDEDSGSSARVLARKKKKKERLEQEQKAAELAEQRKNVIKVTEFLSTSELSNLMNIPVADIIKKCFDLGMMVSINQRLEKDLIELLAAEFGYTIEFQTEYEEDTLVDTEDAIETQKERPPVVTIMGHVDHGKTSLLDYIRNANVVAGEAGGITQHIGAYTVTLPNKKRITFLDTPGHEAFTAMRARGGQAADIVVLVVAADDNVMPQTVEAINHALAANVPIIVAINKVDKPDSNSDRIRQQLADKNILVEDWGGKYQCVEISAKKGMNIDSLLEKILLEAEVLDLKANPDREARGVVLEAKLDKGKGIVATLLVKKGTLNVGDVFICGVYAGKIKAMFDEREHKLEAAGPSQAVQVLGFDGMPQAGDIFIEMNSEREAKEISLKRQQLKREQDFRQVKLVTLDDISKQIKEGKQVELKIILKADADGSAEALTDSLQKLTTPEAKVIVIHKAVGQITESDVTLAEASKAIIIGFNVRPNLNARQIAEKNQIDIRLYNIIYNVIEEVKQALEGLLEPDIEEKVTCTVEVRDTFKVPKIGMVAGCFVKDGKITRNTTVRLLREGFEIFKGKISSLKRFKDDVREVETGFECGISIENFNDIKVGDIIEGYEIVEIKRKLSAV